MKLLFWFEFTTCGKMNGCFANIISIEGGFLTFYLD